MADATIESVLQEDRLFPPSPEFVKQANVSGAVAYPRAYKQVHDHIRDIVSPGPVGIWLG